MSPGRAAKRFAVLATVALLSPTALRAQTCTAGAVVMEEVAPMAPADAPFVGFAPWAPFRDLNLAFVAEAPASVFLEDPTRGEAVEVTLQRLAGTGSRLEGRYVRVTSGRIDDGLPIAGIDGQPDFRFPFFDSKEQCEYDSASCARFDGANVYWHVDRVATAFWRDRMGIDPAFQPTYRVHLSGSGALTDPPTLRVLVRVGQEDLANSALSDDVLYHEYAHLVFWHEGFRVDTSSSHEARALNEGYADYMMATFTGDPVVGEYARACPPRYECLGPPDDEGLRRLDTDPSEWNWRFGNPEENLQYGVCTRYNPRDFKCKKTWAASGYYAWAMIWGSALWDMRKAFGPDVVDRLVLDAVRLDHVPTASLGRAAGYLLAADQARFGGAHEDDLRAIFQQRGIRPSETGVQAASNRAAAGFALYPNPAGSSVTIELGHTDPGGVRTRVADASGRIVLSTRAWAPAAGPLRFTLDLADLPPGIYVIEVVMPSGQRLSRTLARP